MRPIRGTQLRRWPLILSIGLRVHQPILSECPFFFVLRCIEIPRLIFFALSCSPLLSLLYRPDTTFSI